MESAMADWGNSAPVALAQEELHACDTLQEFSAKLRQLYHAASSSLIPELFTIQLAIDSGAMVEILQELPTTLSAAPLNAEPTRSDATNFPFTSAEGTSPLKRRKLQASSVDTTSQLMSVMEVTDSQPEKKPIPIQRSVARSIMNMVIDIDGFGWQMNNTTRTKDGWRLEYVCNDSYQNKARASNKMRKEEASGDTKESRQALPTFDCKGRVLCIFSIQQKNIVVKYSHNPVHRTVASRKQQQNPGYSEKKSDTVSIGPSQKVACDEDRQTGTKVHTLNPLQGPEYGHDNGYPSPTKNPLYQHGSNPGSGVAHSSTRQPSPVNSLSYRSVTPNPLRTPETTSMVTVLQQHERSASIDFSVKRSRALSLLAAAKIDAATLSEFQIQVFQDQDQDSQKMSLKLFEDYGPRQLMVVARDIDGPFNSKFGHSSAAQTSIRASPHQHIRQTSGTSNGTFSDGGGIQTPNSSRPPSSSRIQPRLLPNPYTSNNSSRRSSLASNTEVGSSEGRYMANPTTPGHPATHTNGRTVGKVGKKDTNGAPRGSAAKTELTVNGTPKQPGVFEFDSKKVQQLKATKATKSPAKFGRGKYPRTPSLIRTKSKSLTGCKTCGNRRKKCDGAHPICSTCLKDGKDCIYESATPVPSSPVAAPKSAWDRAKEASEQASSPPPAPLYDDSNIVYDDADDADDDEWLQDLIAASMGVEGT